MENPRAYAHERIYMRKLLTLLFAFLVICNITFIFYQSLRDGESSSAASGAVSDVVADVVAPDLSQRPDTEQKNLMDKIHNWVRKMAHAIEFAGLGFFFCAFILSLQLADKIPFYYKLISAFLFSVSIAVIDEILQLGIEGRAFEMKDIGVDSIGAIIGITVAFLLGLLVQRYWNKRQVAKQ